MRIQNMNTFWSLFHVIQYIIIMELNMVYGRGCFHDPVSINIFIFLYYYFSQGVTEFDYFEEIISF